MALGVLGVVQVVVVMVRFCVYVPAAYGPLQAIFVMVVVRRVRSIFNPIRFSVVSYVNIDSKLERSFIALFTVISAIGYSSAILFLHHFSSRSNTLNTIATRSFALAATGICAGEVLVFGELVGNVLFSHVLVEVAYRNCPLLERKPLSPWDCGIPAVSFEEDADSEMQPIMHGCSHNM